MNYLLVVPVVEKARLESISNVPREYHMKLGEPSQPHKVHITQPLRFTAKTRNRTEATTGLVMGIVGTTLLASGVSTLLIGVAAAGLCQPPHCIQSPSAGSWIYGFGATVAGGVLTPVGFGMYSMYSRNRRTFDETIPGAQATRGDTSAGVRLSMAPNLSGLSGTVTVAF